MLRIPNGTRRYASLAIAAAVLGAAASWPTPAAARPQQEALSCNPSFELCDIQYLYYSEAALINQVGFAQNDCGNGYVLHWGVATEHVKMRYFQCPI